MLLCSTHSKRQNNKQKQNKQKHEATATHINKQPNTYNGLFFFFLKVLEQDDEDFENTEANALVEGLPELQLRASWYVNNKS